MRPKDEGNGQLLAGVELLVYLSGPCPRDCRNLLPFYRFQLDGELKKEHNIGSLRFFLVSTSIGWMPG